MPLEIERKYLVKELPLDYTSYPFFQIEQGYLNLHPTVRIRKEDMRFYLTYKGSGRISREEYNLPLDEISYSHLREKCDGNLVCKKRYHLPIQDSSFQSTVKKENRSEQLIIELDVFEGALAPLVYAEVEFASLEEANAFCPPSWFGKDVSFDKSYSNASLSQQK